MNQPRDCEAQFYRSTLAIVVEAFAVQVERFGAAEKSHA